MKYYIKVMDETNIPKINHMGTIMVNYNRLHDPEYTNGYILIDKLEVSKDVYENIPYSPMTYDDKEVVKFTTDISIYEAFRDGDISEEDFIKIIRNYKQGE